MIPKKIHYCWFSREPYPELVSECISSWHQFMPDWEFVLWDYEKIKTIDSVWLKECLELKKWAFAADFIRVWAVYHEGGIYLDSDVKIYSSLAPFLKHRLFIGRESMKYTTLEDEVKIFLTSHCFGAEAGHPFLKQNLSYYQDRHFRASSAIDLPIDLCCDMLMMPYIQCRLAECYGYDATELALPRQKLKEGIVVYEPEYFCWIPEIGHDVTRYAQHLGLGSWRESDFWARRKSIFTKPLNNWSYKIRWRLVVALRYLAKKLDYEMIRIHPDGWL